MVTKLRSNVGIIILSLVVLIIASGLFYWYQWRPSEIRKICSEESVNKAESEVNKYIKALVPKKADEEINQKKTNYYQDCLTKHGLKPEPLVGK